jgi:Uma2 family endonuclease
MVDQIITRITHEELLRLDAEHDEARVEVEDGEIIISERDMTLLHLLAIKLLYDILNPFVISHRLGVVFMDGLRYRLVGTAADVRRARMPDLSFVRAAGIPPDVDLDGDFPGAPDLAVEVISPGQSNTLLLKKLLGYLEAGTVEGWLIYPRKQEIHVYRQAAEGVVIYSGDMAVDTSLLFPGLTLRASDIFRSTLTP